MTHKLGAIINHTEPKMSKPAPSLKALAEDKDVDHGIGKLTIFKADPNVVQFEDGWNGRDEGPDLIEYRQRLKAAMKAGAFIPPIDVQVVEGVPICRKAQSPAVVAGPATDLDPDEIDWTIPVEHSSPIADGWQLSLAHGHSGYGVYAHREDETDEGSVFVLAVPNGHAELVAVIGESCGGGVADGADVIKSRLADAMCAIVDRSGLKRKEVAQMLGVTEANLSIKLSGDTNLTIMSVANIVGAVGGNLTFRVGTRDA